MTDKSHVSMETKICPICGKEEDSGAILLHRRLRPTLAPKTATGYDLCAEHRQKHEEGFVALVELVRRPSAPDFETQVRTPRTGNVAHVRREAWTALFNVPAPTVPFVFCEAGTIAKLQERYEADLKAQGEGG